MPIEPASDWSRHPKFRTGFIILILALMVVVVVVGLELSLRAGRSLTDTLGRQFNEQQLITARNAKDLIERELDLVKGEIRIVARQVNILADNQEGLKRVIDNSMLRIAGGSVRRVEILEPEAGKVFLYTPNRHAVVEKPLAESSLDQLDLDAVAPDRVWVSRPGMDHSRIAMFMATVLEGPGRRLLVFELNATLLARPFLKNIRSGQLGYAWLIDGQGRFIYHYISEFIGKLAFQARQERNPDISFEEINRIQQDKMLRGREGVGFYYSGWHRGSTGLIKKLIAYTPVSISSHPPQQWSVAVVSPFHDMENAVNHRYTWQFLLVVFSISIMVVSFGALIFLEIRWSRTLGRRVEARTEELRRSEERYRLLVESAEDYIFTVDRDGKLQSMNNYTAKFFGGSPEELVGRGFEDLFPEPVASRLGQEVDKVYGYGKSRRDEFELDTDESSIWLNIHLMPIKEQGGGVGRVLCIARDITESKELERNLVNTEKLASLGTLAAGVAHEVNNPLGVILGFSDILLKKAEPGSQEAGDLEVIRRQGHHCKEVVANLLAFARQEDPEAEYCDLNECLIEILQISRHSLEMNNIDLDIETGEGLPLVLGHKRKLQQVFLNLVNNSMAAMSRGGEVTVTTGYERSSRRVVVVFQDDGEGITQKDLKRIFDPFFTTKSVGEGTGLGLFVTYGIIKQYGGTIECLSSGPDQPDRPSGTQFIIKLQPRKPGRS